MSLHQQRETSGAAEEALPSHPLPLANGQKLVPGIVGGLGPLPHIHFETLLLKKAQERALSADGVAGAEQCYPFWILANAAPTPDRTKCLLENTAQCVPALVGAAQGLARGGADFLVVICNTAHAFRPSSREYLSIPWVDLLGVVAAAIKRAEAPVQTVGLLATSGTIKTELYPRALAQHGLEKMTLIYPSDAEQQRVMSAIYDPPHGVKSCPNLTVSPQAIAAFEQSARHLMARGADVIVAGCTEISLCSAELGRRGIPIIDPLDELAAVVVKLAYGELNVESFT